MTTRGQRHTALPLGKGLEFYRPFGQGAGKGTWRIGAVQPKV